MKLSLTVPSSTYTAVPAAAMRAPTSHIKSATPTLPEERRMTLGVATILHQKKVQSTEKYTFFFFESI
jgi:hypothetical protein